MELEIDINSFDLVIQKHNGSRFFMSGGVFLVVITLAEVNVSLRNTVVVLLAF